MKRLIGVFILANLGCVDLGDTLYVENDFTDEEFSQIESAVNEWADATDDESIRFKVGPRFDADSFFTVANDWEGGEFPFAIHKILMSDPGYITLRDGRVKSKHNGIAGSDFCGIANDSLGRIAIVIECIMREDVTFREVVLHELGHIYGLGHSFKGLMTAEASTPDCIDSFTLRAYCEENSCGPKAKPTCK